MGVNVRRIFCWVILCLSLLTQCIFAQGQTGTSTTEKHDERGFLKASSTFMDGNETVSEYDGSLNLCFSIPFDLPNGMKSSLSVIYNPNVEHRVYVNNSDCHDGYSVNSPEWIIGAYGFALQALNFEANFFMSSGQDKQGTEVPQLIPGYHYSNHLNQSSGNYDFIDLLMADGSKMRLYNTEAKTSQHSVDGYYVEAGNDAKAWADVQILPGPNGLREMWLYRGDGLTYYFKEELMHFYDRPFQPNSSLLNPRAMYLQKVYSNYGDTVKFIYKDSSYIYGRNELSFITTSYPWGTAYHYPNHIAFGTSFYNYPTYFGERYSMLELQDVFSYTKYKLYVKNYTSVSNYAYYRDGAMGRSQISMIYKIVDQAGRETNIDYDLKIRKYKYDSGPLFSFNQTNYLPVKIAYYNGKETYLTYKTPTCGVSNGSFTTYYDLYPDVLPLNFGTSTMSNINSWRNTFRDD